MGKALIFRLPFSFRPSARALSSASSDGTVHQANVKGRSAAMTGDKSKPEMSDGGWIKVELLVEATL